MYLCINFSKVVQVLEFMCFKVKSLSKDKACDYLGGSDVSLTPSLKVIWKIIIFCLLQVCFYLLHSCF